MMWQTMQNFVVQQQMQMAQIMERQNTRDRQFGDVLAGMLKKQGISFEEVKKEEDETPKDVPAASAARAAPVAVVDGPVIEEINTEDEEEWPKEAEKALRA
eukprot:8139578-Karenia_brevis.AAC.1